MTAHGTAPRRRRRGVTALLLLALILTVVGGVSYVNYRVNRFTTSAFRGETTPPRTQFGVETPTTAPTPVPTAAPGTTPEPLPTTGAAPPGATPTPSATPLPYGNSPIIERFRRGERVTVLVVGFGGAGHDGGYLTDSIQVVSFEPVSGQATLISVPRDLWVYIPPFAGRGGYWGKINEAYTIGMGRVDRNDFNVPYALHDQGGTLVSKVVAQVLGIPIDYWMSLDFVGFRQFIDALGGVQIDVPTAFTDTRYPNNDDASVDPSYKTVTFTCGPQRLNGERAIEYARSRYSPQDGSDFSRSRRQQQLLKAVKEQTFRVETIPKVFSLLNAVEGHFHTSFSFTEVRDLAGWAQERARNKRPISVSSVVLETGDLFYATTSSAGAYIIVPRMGQGEYSAVHAFVRGVLAGDALSTPGTAAASPVSRDAPATLGTPAASPVSGGDPGTPAPPTPSRTGTPTSCGS